MVKDWLKKLNCSHEWETYSSTYHQDRNFGGYDNYTLDTLICKKCGKIKQIRI